MGSKKYRGWERGPRRDEVKATDPQPKPQKAKKDTHRWCRGKVGVEHQLEPRLSKNYAHLLRLRGDLKCEWQANGRWRIVPNQRRRDFVPDGTWSYCCYHEIACTDCGKIMRYFLRAVQCPDYRPKP